VTNFFEVIKVSATHIYHSALELCPLSSVVRRRYYHRRTTRSPEVVFGTPDSWEPTVAASSDYGFSTWSPCGRFVAAQTYKAVEIRNQLTLELITILQPPGTIHDFGGGPLGYSPDGRFIACAHYRAGIIIWDIQTGGVAKEIKYSIDNYVQFMVWSPDGGTICTVESDINSNKIVHTYDISPGTISSPGTLQSYENPYLWVDDKSFWIMTMRDSGDGVDIFEVGSTLTRIQSFDFPFFSRAEIGSFSPTTHRVSISSDTRFRIIDIQNSNLLLDDYGSLSHCFSSDGSLFAASGEGIVRIWEYTSGRYILWREFRCPNSPHFLQFSPTLSSIMGTPTGILQVWRLHELPTTPKTHRRQHVGLSRSGTRVATAHELENTVTITDLVGQSPPQFIDTDVEIQRLVLIGNVLVVAGSRETVAWLLTEEGLVDGVIGDRRVVRSDSIWTTSQPTDPWWFGVWGQVGVLVLHGDALHVYHTETGEVLDPTQIPNGVYSDRTYYNNIPQCNTPPEDSWQTSQDTLREGWVKDPEGKHRMWVPAEWRKDWGLGEWHHDVTTQFSHLGGRFVLVKF